MNDREQRIRDIAYFLWLEEGSPEGRPESHWLAAEGLVESEPEEEARIEDEHPTEPNRRPLSVATVGSD